MPIPRTTAQRLVSETEFRLINESFPPLVATLSDKGLLQRMERARKARDRYHDAVERQQSKTASGAQSSRPSANLKEAISKEKLFEETLTRFERQTAKAGNNGGVKASHSTTTRGMLGKKSGQAKTGSQGASKSSVKMANKAAAKSGNKTAAPKAGKGKGGATKTTPRGRHGAMTANTTLH